MAVKEILKKQEVAERTIYNVIMGNTFGEFIIKTLPERNGVVIGDNITSELINIKDPKKVSKAVKVLVNIKKHLIVPIVGEEETIVEIFKKGDMTILRSSDGSVLVNLHKEIPARLIMDQEIEKDLADNYVKVFVR